MFTVFKLIIVALFTKQRKSGDAIFVLNFKDINSFYSNEKIVYITIPKLKFGKLKHKPGAEILKRT